MSTAHLGLKNNYLAGTPVSASDLNLRANWMDTQGVGALQGLGSGIFFPVPAASKALSPDFKVSAGSGLHVFAAAGLGVIVDESYGAVFVANVASSEIGDGEGETLTDDSADNYLFVAIEVEVSGNDSRYSAVPKFVVQDTDELSGALLLARIHTAAGAITSIDDLRVVNRWDDNLLVIAALQAAVEALQAIVGTYDVELLGTIVDRLAALESGGGGGGGPSYWLNLARSSTDAQTILQAITAALTQHVQDYHSATASVGSGGVIERHRDETAVNGLDTLYRILCMDETKLVDIPPFRAAVFSPGRGNWEDLYSSEYTTVTLDDVAHTIG